MATIVTPSNATTPYAFTRNERYTLVAFGLIALYIVLYGTGLLPVSLQIPCPSYQYLGLQCAGCGLSRAGAALTRADFSEAFLLSPVFPWIVLYVVYRVSATIYGLRTNRHLIQDIPSWLRTVYVCSFIAVATSVQGIRLVHWLQQFF